MGPAVPSEHRPAGLDECDQVERVLGALKEQHPEAEEIEAALGALDTVRRSLLWCSNCRASPPEPRPPYPTHEEVVRCLRACAGSFCQWYQRYEADVRALSPKDYQRVRGREYAIRDILAAARREED